MTLSLSYIQAGGKTIGMEVSIVVPSGYWLEGLSIIRPEEFWRCALRVQVPPRTSELGQFFAAVGRTPQEAVDKAVEELERQKRRDSAVPRVAPQRTLTVDDLDF